MSPISKITCRIRSLAGDGRGAALVEFGLILPVLALLVMGTFDVGQLALAHMKIYNSASSMADLVARDKTISNATLTDLFGAASQVAQPLDLDGKGKVIITSVSADAPNDPRIFWQAIGTGALAATSAVGTTIGASANLPPSMQVDDQETIIVAEVFYKFEPIIGLLDVGTTIYHSAYYRPRLGTLREVLP